MTEQPEKHDDSKARESDWDTIFDYSMVGILCVCCASTFIMYHSFESGNAFAGALAVAALCGMVVGVISVLVRMRND